MRKKVSGFTLIEVIVAVSLLAAAMALTFATLRGATRATGHAEAMAQRNEKLRAVQGFLRTQMGSALPIAFAVDPETGDASFVKGSAEKLEFVATMPGYMSRGGPYLQALEFVSGRTGQSLVFQHQLLTSDGPLAAEREPVTLLNGIAEGRFEFRSLDENGSPTDWQTTWEASSQLPPMVRVVIVFKDTQRHWPEFVAVFHLSPPSAIVAASGDHGGRQ